MMQQTGKVIMVAGIVLVLIGLVVWLAGDKLSWLGKLPGDIRVEKENFRFYFPITTMILLSVVLSLLIALFRKLF